MPTLSRLLVSLQFLLIGLIAWPCRPPALEVWPAALFGAGIAVFFAALRAMGVRTFTVMPEPKAGGELITRGIYRLVRHPMYLAVLLCAVAASWSYMSLGKWALTLLLAMVLAVKFRREEKQLLERFEGYAAYRARTRAIIPFLL